MVVQSSEPGAHVKSVRRLLAKMDYAKVDFAVGAKVHAIIRHIVHLKAMSHEAIFPCNLQCNVCRK